VAIAIHSFVCSFNHSSGATMQAFLGAARASLLAAKGAEANAAKVSVCIGNEAGDLDTVVSSIGAAWVLHAQGQSAVPLMPFMRDDLRLRRDVLRVLTRANITADDLVFWDDACFDDKTSLREVGLVLTDHNDPCPELTERFPGPVVGILDHHSDACKFMDVADRVVDPGAGSACSIVAERVLGMSEDPPLELVRMLLDTIAVDSRAFSKSANRFSERDTAAFEVSHRRSARVVGLCDRRIQPNRRCFGYK
jgi:exopolyphosphatase